jgi:hypothetical protein
MILEEIQHHLDRIEAAQQRCEEQPTDVATIVVLLNALAMAVKDLLREAIPWVSARPLQQLLQNVLARASLDVRLPLRLSTETKANAEPGL